MNAENNPDPVIRITKNSSIKKRKTIHLKDDEDFYIKKPGRQFPGFRRNFYDYFAEYSNNTGIHGFKYMGDHEMTIFERIWWLILFFISVCICIKLILDTYNKWDTSPVLVSFARSPTPVWQVPFPAITICSETKTRQTVFNFTDYYGRLNKRVPENITDEEMNHLETAGLVCENHLITNGNKTTDYKSIQFLMEAAPTMEEVLWSCKYTLNNQSCADYFTKTITEEGQCFTFNMLDKSELLKNNVYIPEGYMRHEQVTLGWSLEKGYTESSLSDAYPRRAQSAGFSSGFLLTLRAFEKDLDYMCRGPSQGFKIQLHNPAEPPRIGMQFFRAPLNQEVVVAVKPDMITTSDALKDYDPFRRQCFFPSERNLAFYKSYTQQNCEVECLTNYTLEKCGCVAYHMPHEESTPLCGTGSNVCMFMAQSELLQKEVKGGLMNEEDLNANRTTLCHCLPSCTSLVYNAETSQTDYKWEKTMLAFRVNMSEFPEGQKVTRINIFFKEQQFIPMERNELYGETDFLANCGGILGLFTGFSFLSIVEVIYFLTLKLICNVKRYGRHYWSGSPELVNNDMYIH